MWRFKRTPFVCAVLALAICIASAKEVVYLTDLPLYSSLTEYLCPPEPTALAPCACDKNQNSLRISQSINSVVGQGCLSNKDDVKSAQAMFAAYCGMNSGTTSFPTTTLPPGDMSYYVTNLPQYASLDTCAQLCVDIAAMYQTTSFCANNGPEALASCLCLKTSVSKTVSSELTWQIRNHCHTNMLDNLSSANAVLDYYCSAARGAVTATGISVSQSQDASSRTGSGSMASETNSPDDPKDDKSGSPSAGVIAGAVVGSVVGLLAGGACVFFFMRRAAQRKQEGHASEERNGNHGVVRLESVSASQVDPAVAPPPYEERPSQPISKS
ncbi:hypothetical protein FDECE_12070 [Fusarium decemcellulare]|nr:hypothetical protein FDECE_12070 [Fusarium decemcellulare]